MQSYNSYRGGASYSEEYVDKNYKIPKRKASEMDNSSTASNNNYNAYYNQRQQQNQNQQQNNRQQNQQPHQQTPLANSYYNYNNNSNYQYPNTTAYYGAYAQYYSAYNSAMTAAQPPPPPPPGEAASVDPVTQGIYKALTDIKEKPKNYRSNIYSNNNNYYKQRKGSQDSPKYMPFQSTVPDILDETLPKELKSLFQPLFCKLCSSQLSSNLNAKMHYKSKNHEKKIKKWLVEYSERTGEPLHKRAKLTNEQKTEESDKNPAWFHCDICDLPLTGKLHAESHYSGRNHQKAMMGHKTPAGTGYYNNEGKWVRTKSGKSKSYNFENGEDNFGHPFKPVPVSTVEIAPISKPAKQPKVQTTFTCEVCNINTTCQEQLETHYRGAKHQKKLKQVGLAKYTEQRELVEKSATISAPPINFTCLTENLPLSTNGKSELNLSVYRTPSGDYYCPSCNITSNAEPQFVQHMASKNHSKKVQKKNI